MKVLVLTEHDLINMGWEYEGTTLNCPNQRRHGYLYKNELRYCGKEFNVEVYDNDLYIDERHNYIPKVACIILEE